MSAPLATRPPEELLLRLREDRDRTLPAEEFDAYVNAPWSAEELEDARALIAWFRRRYPTPAARLASARRALAGGWK